MPRPKPKVLLEAVGKKHKKEEVIEAEAVYAVFYKGKPIGLKTSNNLFDYPGPKYPKTTFINPGFAFNLAEKLNKKFNTSHFQVFKLSGGTPIAEEDV